MLRSLDGAVQVRVMLLRVREQRRPQDFLFRRLSTESVFSVSSGSVPVRPPVSED
jgi:hypothetical protein